MQRYPTRGSGNNQDILEFYRVREGEHRRDDPKVLLPCDFLRGATGPKSGGSREKNCYRPRPIFCTRVMNRGSARRRS